MWRIDSYSRGNKMRDFGGGKNLYEGLSEIERRLDVIENAMLNIAEAFANEFPLRGPGGLFIRIFWMRRRGSEVPMALHWRTLKHGRISHKNKWGKDVGKKLTNSVIYRAGLYSKRGRVWWYAKEIDRLRRQRKKLVASWDRIRKILSPYFKNLVKNTNY